MIWLETRINIDFDKRTVTPGVAGSSPVRSAKEFKSLIAQRAIRLFRLRYVSAFFVCFFIPKGQAISPCPSG